jgi:hypothetical protein
VRDVRVGEGPDWSVYEFSYEGDRPTRVEVDSAGWDEPAVYLAEYDGAGALRRITYEGRPVYVAPRRSLEELVGEVKERLVEAIPEALAAVALPEPAYALALGFNKSSSEELLPPQLGLGLESNRRHFAAERDRESIWNPILFPDAPEPSEFPLDFPLDEGLEEAVLQLRALLLERDDVGPVESLLVDVAKALNARDWSTVLPVTEDFIVYPVDYEDPSWRPYMARAVPERILTGLQKARLL